MRFFLKTLVCIFVFLFSMNFVFSVDYAGVCDGAIVSGSHTMSADVLGDDSNCFVSTADDIIFDCQGHIVGGDSDTSGYGLYFTGDNITIKNCVVGGFHSGVRMVNSLNFTILNVNVTNSTSYGVFVQNNLNGYLENIRITNNSLIGIMVDSSDNVTIDGLVVNTSATGLSFDADSYNCSVSNVYISHLTGSGIFACKQDSYFENVKIYDIVSYGMSLGTGSPHLNNVDIEKTNNGIYSGVISDFSMRNIRVNDSAVAALRINGGTNGIVENVNLSNSDYGLYYSTPSSSNVINRNIRAFSNSVVGVWFALINTSVLENSFIYDNLDGLQLETGVVNYNVISDVLIVNNTDDGIYLRGGEFNIIKNCNVSNNGGYGVRYFTAAYDNTFYNNYFESASTFLGVATYGNYYNATLGGYGIGNYWADLSCVDSEMRGGFDVCINPGNYTLSAGSYYDYAPLASWDPYATISGGSGSGGSSSGSSGGAFDFVGFEGSLIALMFLVVYFLF